MEEWSKDELKAYLSERGLAAEAVGYLWDNDVDGSTLKSVKEEDLLYLGLKSRITVWKELQLLLKNGYASTAGAVQEQWEQFEVIDFAGQMEYYVTHQLFLSGMHCM